MNLAIKIEDMVDEANEIKSLALAVHDAIYGTCNSYRGYEGASSVIIRLAQEHSEHLSTLMDAVIAMQKNKKTGENAPDRENHMEKEGGRK